MGDFWGAVAAVAAGAVTSTIGVVGTTRNQASRLAALEAAKIDNEKRLAAAEAEQGRLRDELASVKRSASIDYGEVERRAAQVAAGQLATLGARVENLYREYDRLIRADEEVARADRLRWEALQRQLGEIVAEIRTLSREVAR